MKLTFKDILFSNESLETLQSLELTNSKESDLEAFELTENEIGNAFGKSLKELRLYKKLSLAKLGKLIDIPPQTLNRYEHGINIPTITQALKISSFFEINNETMILYGLIPYKKDFNIIKHYEIRQLTLKFYREQGII